MLLAFNVEANEYFIFAYIYYREYIPVIVAKI